MLVYNLKCSLKFKCFIYWNPCKQLGFLKYSPPVNRLAQELLCKVKWKASLELCFQGMELKFKDFFDRDTEGEDKGIPFNIYKYPSTNFSVKN